MGTPASRDGRLRASHADREQMVDTLKAAFVQGRLTHDELDARVGQALAARTYADLAVLTADLPVLTADLPVLTAEPARSPAPIPDPTGPPAQRPRNRAAARAVQAGAGAIAALILGIFMAAAAAGRPDIGAAAAVAITVFSAVVTAFVAALIAATVKLESLARKRSRGHRPPPRQDGQGGPAALDPGRAGPSGPPTPRPRHPYGSLAVGRPG